MILGRRKLAGAPLIPGRSEATGERVHARYSTTPHLPARGGLAHASGIPADRATLGRKLSCRDRTVRVARRTERVATRSGAPPAETCTQRESCADLRARHGPAA